MSDPIIRPRKVLIIDDNADAAETLCSLIGMLGYDACYETDGETGIACAQAMVPDVILLDIGMPLMDGFQVARALRQVDILAACRVVALTAWGDESTKVRAAECGFDAHLTKPASIQLLRQELDLSPSR